MKMNADIQVLRCVALLLAMIHHSPLHEALPSYFGHTSTGVDLFFVVSAYLITASLIRSHAGEARRELLVGYYCRRFFKIMPAAGFWLAVFFVAAVLATLVSDRGSGFSSPTAIALEIAQIVGLVYNYNLADHTAFLGHIWTLVVQEHFYLLLPFVVLPLYRRRWLPLVCVIGIVVVTVTRPYAADIYHMTHARLDALFYGILIALYVEHVRSFLELSDALSSRRFRRVIALVAGALLLLLAGTFAQEVNAITITQASILATLLVLIAALNKDVVLPIPYVRPFLLWIGERSYSIYLSHPLVYYSYNILWQDYYERMSEFLRVSNGGFAMHALLLFLTSLLVGHISYHLIEAPSVKFGARLLKGRRSAPEAVEPTKTPSAASAPV